MPSLNNHSSGTGASSADVLPACAASVAAAEATGDSSPRSGRVYWRSLEEYLDTPEFQTLVDHEFPMAASEPIDADERRHFIKIMGASFALAGLTLAGCRRWPEEKIAPYAHRPVNRDPGNVVDYATSFDLGGVGQALVARSFDGRPIKVEGNDLDESSRGASSGWAQASILDLYDQDRSRETWRGDAKSNWSAFAAALGERMGAMRSTGGEGLAVLSGASGSPSQASMREAFRKAFPKARWDVYEPVNNDAEREGTALALGAPHRVHLRIADPGGSDAAAKVIVSLDADFLFAHPDHIRHMRELARSRRVRNADPARQELSRLYVFESDLSTTGMSADERVAIRSTDVAAVSAAIATGLGVDAGAGYGALDRLAGSAVLDEHARKVVDAAVRDLAAAKGASIVVAGPHQPPAVHALVCLINQHLGSTGRTVLYTSDPEPNRPSSAAAIASLAKAIADGAVETLVVLGANPVYNAPADLDFASLIKKVPFAVHQGLYRDETARLCTWHVPAPHYLECWGDNRSWDGTIAVQQPLIEPMIDPSQGGRSALELVAAMTGSAQTGEEIVRSAFAARKGLGGAELDRQWRLFLHDGVLKGTAWEAAKTSPDWARVGPALASLADAAAASAKAGLEVVFRPDSKVYDGRWSNNGWLQELPDTTTKLTWDNAAILGPATAKSQGVGTGDVVELSVGGRKLEIAVYVLPGHAEGSVTLPLGYGRGESAGRIAAEAGFDTYRLRTSNAMGMATGAGLSPLGRRYELVSVQDRGGTNPVAEQGRQDRLPTLVRETTLPHYREHPDFAQHASHVAHRLSLWEESNLDGAKHRWAMSIDLNACTGCSACVVACQAENNIPIVGKEQVRRGREMHWIRIDRYFRGPDPAKPEATVCIPVTCMHCENAPCEQVCPVAATVHDKDGLNVMVYNRCVGTRYCSNNCPYKVRRFNYFDWHRKFPVRSDDWIQTDPGYYVRYGPDNWKRMQFNPEVTVRMRGVMEKCTFCVQRISSAKIEAKNAWAAKGGRDGGASDYSIADGAITPACAHACPAEAIVFGDLNDPKSRVAQLHRSKLSYQMLEELNTKTRLQYLARVRNPGLEGHAGSEAEKRPSHGHELGSIGETAGHGAKA